MCNIQRSRNLYISNKYDMLDRIIVFISFFMLMLAAGADITWIYTDTLCNKSILNIFLWISAISTIAYYIFYILSFCYIDAVRDDKLYYYLKISHFLYHILFLVVNIPMIFLFLNIYNHCDEWFVAYMWTKLGICLCFSLSVIVIMSCTTFQENHYPYSIL